MVLTRFVYSKSGAFSMEKTSLKTRLMKDGDAWLENRDDDRVSAGGENETKASWLRWKQLARDNHVSSHRHHCTTIKGP